MVFIRIFWGETPNPPIKEIIHPLLALFSRRATREGAPDLVGPPGVNFLDPPLEVIHFDTNHFRKKENSCVHFLHSSNVQQLKDTACHSSGIRLRCTMVE